MIVGREMHVETATERACERDIERHTEGRERDRDRAQERARERASERDRDRAQERARERASERERARERERESERHSIPLYWHIVRFRSRSSRRSRPSSSCPLLPVLLPTEHRHNQPTDPYEQPSRTVTNETEIKPNLDHCYFLV